MPQNMLWLILWNVRTRHPCLSPFWRRTEQSPSLVMAWWPLTTKNLVRKLLQQPQVFLLCRRISINLIPTPK